MRRMAIALALAGTLAQGAAADEFTDVVEGALEAYGEGDVAGARDDLEYGLKLLTEMKAETLATFLPEPPAGWTKAEADAEGAAIGMAMFGGGTAAAATYTRGTESFTLTLLANSPLVGGLGAMVSGMASVAGSETLRIQRTEFSVQGDELQGVVGGTVLVGASGGVPARDKADIIDLMDLRALAEF